MKVKVQLFGDQDWLNIDEAHIDTMGITYQKESGIIIPGEEDAMTMVLIPWAAVTRMEYVITPDMIAPDPSYDTPVEGDIKLNREQRRAAKL